MYKLDKTNKTKDKYKQSHFENNPKIKKLPNQTGHKHEKNPNMSNLRACNKYSSSMSSNRTTLLDEFSIEDTLLISTSSKTEYSVFFHNKNFPSCQTPPIPKKIQTRPKFQPLLDDHDGEFVKTRSRAQRLYTNILKQPVSPGVRLSSFISSLFGKDGKKNRSNKECKLKQASRSCLSVNNSPTMRNNFHDGDKPTASFNGYGDNRGRFEKERNLEEVALDLLNGYWDQELSKTYKLSKKCGDNKVNDSNYGVNYVQDNREKDYEDDDGFSCSSSDLFELDHLSLISDELPVYETTRFDNKIM